MGRGNAARLLVLSLISVLANPNCATLFRDPEQKIPVTSSPAGATVFVNGVEKGATPIMIWPLRGKKGQVIRIEASGYNPLEIRLKRRWSPFPVLGGVLVGAIVCGGYCLYYDFEEDLGIGPVASFIIGAAVGVGAGIKGSSGYSLRPAELAVTLTKVDGTPKVDTILLDADDLENIKWIRVRRD